MLFQGDSLLQNIFYVVIRTYFLTRKILSLQIPPPLKILLCYLYTLQITTLSTELSSFQSYSKRLKFYQGLMEPHTSNHYSRTPLTTDQSSMRDTQISVRRKSAPNFFKPLLTGLQYKSRHRQTPQQSVHGSGQQQRANSAFLKIDLQGAAPFRISKVSSHRSNPFLFYRSSYQTTSQNENVRDNNSSNKKLVRMYRYQKKHMINRKLKSERIDKTNKTLNCSKELEELSSRFFVFDSCLRTVISDISSQNIASEKQTICIGKPISRRNPAMVMDLLSKNSIRASRTVDNIFGQRRRSRFEETKEDELANLQLEAQNKTSHLVIDGKNPRYVCM